MLAMWIQGKNATLSYCAAIKARFNGSIKSGPALQALPSRSTKLRGPAIYVDLASQFLCRNVRHLPGFASNSGIRKAFWSSSFLQY